MSLVEGADCGETWVEDEVELTAPGTGAGCFDDASHCSQRWSNEAENGSLTMQDAGGIAMR